MNENFGKLKRAAVGYAVLFSVLAGLGTGGLTAAAIMLLTKLFFALHPLLYLVSVAVAAVTSVLLYLLVRPTDERLARKLDADFSLGERAATSVEFRGQEGEILELQREDVEQRLSGISASRLRPKKLIAAILIFAVSLGALAGAFFVPEKTEGQIETPMDAFDKQWILASIAELIETVQKAYMDETLRTQMLADLQSLSDFVEASDYLSEMKSKGIETIKSIHGAMRRINSASAIGETASEGYGEAVTALGDALCELSGVSVKKALTSIAASLKDATEEDILHAADELNALVTASGVRIDDPVAVIFKSLIAATHAAAASSDSLTGVYEDAAAQLSPLLILQSVNQTIVTRVINELCELFGITQEDLITPEGDVEVELREPDAVEPGDKEEEEEDEDDVISGGGLGTGETLYGSNDVIYDPNTDTYTPYGEILQRYFDAFTEQKLDGKISADFIEKLNEYFAALYGGSDDE